MNAITEILNSQQSTQAPQRMPSDERGFAHLLALVGNDQNAAHRLAIALGNSLPARAQPAAQHPDLVMQRIGRIGDASAQYHQNR